jgi:hypothetical protein
MKEPHTKHPGPVLPHATTDNHTGESDRSPITRLEREKPRPIGLGVVAAQVPDLRAVDQHRDGVRIVGVVRLGQQDGVDVDSNALDRATAGHPPERILVVALAHNLEVVASAE